MTSYSKLRQGTVVIAKSTGTRYRFIRAEPTKVKGTKSELLTFECQEPDTPGFTMPATEFEKLKTRRIFKIIDQ